MTAAWIAQPHRPIMPYIIIGLLILALAICALQTLVVWGVATGLHFASALLWGELRGGIAAGEFRHLVTARQRFRTRYCHF